tara:strand:- start:64 stop:231 length:168 start_codon:yes stop_codon:yes gene_type:complete
MIPYEKKLINKSLLTKEEIQQINEYHEMVFKKLKQLIYKNDVSLVNFLRHKTSSL